MNRKEAIHTLKDIFDYFWIEIEDRGIDGELTKIMEVLEKPITLEDLLGWQEGVEYEYYPAQNNEVTEKAKIIDNIFYVFISSADDFVKCPIYSEDIPNMKQAKRVEKQIAYHVKDEYSYNCLIMELEERGHTKAPHFNGYNSYIPIIYINSDGKYSGAMLDSIIARSHIIVEYHKEEPKYYAELKVPAGIKTRLWLKRLNYDVTVFDLVSWFQLDKSDAKTKTEWGKLGIDNTNVNFKEVIE